MNYDSFLMYNLLIEEGVSVDGMSFGDYPLDERYDMMPFLFKAFDSHPLNDPREHVMLSILSYLKEMRHSLVSEPQIYELSNIEVTNQEYWRLCNAVKAGEFDKHPCGYTIYKLTQGSVYVKGVSNA